MLSEGMLNELDLQVAKAQALVLAPLIPAGLNTAEDVLQAPHFVLYVQNLLEQRYGPDALTRGGRTNQLLFHQGRHVGDAKGYYCRVFP
jgi:hypothetical protein